MRMFYSALNSNLFYFLNILDNPSCACGFNTVTPSHYFLSCPRFFGVRQHMIKHTGNITTVDSNKILFGGKTCTLQENNSILNAVFQYIKSSMRFQPDKEYIDF